LVVIYSPRLLGPSAIAVLSGKEWLRGRVVKGYVKEALYATTEE